MDPLITIETVPIKIEYVEKEASQSTAMQSAKLNISRNDNSVTIQSDPISIPLTDTFELRSSDDWNHLTYTATAQYSGRGNLRMSVQMQGDSNHGYQYQQFDRGIDSIIDSVSPTNHPTDRQKYPVGMDNMLIDFDMSGFIGRNPSEINTIDTSFFPPDLELKVVERAKVIVKYVGGPIYFPRSADPEFDPAESTLTYFPASADPNYEEFETSEGLESVYFPESSDPNYDSKMAQGYNGRSKLDLKA